jgi:hypothetical protein
LLGRQSGRDSIIPVAENGRAVHVKWAASDVPAFELGASHAGTHALDDQVPFQLCDSANEDHDGAAQRSAGVDIFAERGLTQSACTALERTSLIKFWKLFFP